MLDNFLITLFCSWYLENKSDQECGSRKEDAIKRNASAWVRAGQGMMKKPGAREKLSRIVYISSSIAVVAGLFL